MRMGGASQAVEGEKARLEGFFVNVKLINVGAGSAFNVRVSRKPHSSFANRAEIKFYTEAEISIIPPRSSIYQLVWIDDLVNCFDAERAPSSSAMPLRDIATSLWNAQLPEEHLLCAVKYRDIYGSSGETVFRIGGLINSSSTWIRSVSIPQHDSNYAFIPGEGIKQFLPIWELKESISLQREKSSESYEFLS